MNSIIHNVKTPVRLALAAAAVCAALAGAARADEVPQKHVRYSDLDVNSTAGADALLRRIRIAANQVCGADTVNEMARSARAQACAVRAIAEAVTAVNNPMLTREYEVKTGVTPSLQLASHR